MILTMLMPLVGALILLIALGVNAWQVRPTKKPRTPKALAHVTRGGLMTVASGALCTFILVRLFFTFAGLVSAVWVIAIALLAFVAFRVVQLWPSEEDNDRLVASLQDSGVKVGSRQGTAAITGVVVVVIFAVLVWFAPVMF